MSNHKSKIKMALQSLTPVSEFLDSRCADSVSTRHAYTSGLMSINNFISPKNTLETILDQLKSGKMDLYKLLDSFTSDQRKKVSVRTTRLNLAVLRSYLNYHDIDIIQQKFEKRVKVPKLHKAKEAAIDAADIRKIILVCSNRRLKVYVLVLASGGMRAVEALSLRIQDIDFRTKPTKVHIREEYAKTRVARDIYISDEAADYLEKWIAWKYRNGRQKNLDDLVFGVGYSDNPRSLYVDISHEFSKLLDLAGFSEKKDNSIRHRITLHSLRRFVDSTITASAGQDYTEWFLGHSDNTYYTKKESELAEIYKTKCMKFLTFLDYSVLESTGKGIENQLSVKEQEIDNLRQGHNELMDQMSEKDSIMKKATQAIDLLMKKSDEDSKRIEQLESLIAKVLPIGKEIGEIKEEVGETLDKAKVVQKVKAKNIQTFPKVTTAKTS
jgi:integrase